MIIERPIKNGIVYCVQVQHNGLRRRLTVGPDLAQAKKVEARTKKELQAEAIGKPTPPQPDELRFKDFVPVYFDYAKSYKKSWKTDTYLMKSLLAHFGDMAMSKITPVEILSYIQSRRNTVSHGKPIRPKTINLALSLLSVVFRLAIEMGRVTDNPCRKVRWLKVDKPKIQFLTVEEIGSLLAVARHPLKGILMVAVHAGLRRSEIMNLRWEDIDIKNGLMQIPVTKNGQSRVAYLTSELAKTFSEMEHMPGCPFVFHDKTGKPFHDVRKSFSTALRNAGITRHIRFHDLRHTFASHAAMSGVDLLTLRDMLGHSSTEMVERYAHLSDQHRRDATKKLEAGLLGLSTQQTA